MQILKKGNERRRKDYLKRNKISDNFAKNLCELENSANHYLES